MFKKVLVVTIISILIFFSVSFIDFLSQIPPLKEERFDLRIGVPFNYYYELYPWGGFNHGWNLINLVYDCIIIWSIVMLFSSMKIFKKTTD